MLIALFACTATPGDSEKTAFDDSVPVEDTDETDDTAETGETGETDDTAETGETGDPAPPTYIVCPGDDGVYDDLQGAIDAMGDGAVLTVCSGTFDGFVIDDYVIVVNGSGDTIIDGGDSSAVHSHHGAVQLSGVTMRGTQDGDHGGVVAGVLGMVLLRDVVIEGNGTDTLVTVEEGSLLVENVRFVGNEASVDAESSLISLTMGSTAVIERAEFSGNTAATIISADGGSISLNNVIVHGGELGVAGVLDVGSSPVTASNLVIHGVSTPAETIILGAEDLSVQNSIFADLGGAALATGEVRYSLSWDTTAGLAVDLDNLSADPLFSDAAAGDFTLQAGSPAMDAGNPDAAYNDVDGSRNDLGAFGGPDGGW